MDLSSIGLIVITISWLIQFGFSIKGNKSVRPEFVIVYCIGVLLLVIDGFTNNLTNIAVLNVASLIGALLVLIAILKK